MQQARAIARSLNLRIETNGLPSAALNSQRIETLEEITSKLSDFLLAVEFESGFVVRKNAAEE